MGFIDECEHAEPRVEFAPQVLVRRQGDFNISGDLAVALPALLVDGVAIVLLATISGAAYYYFAFGNVGQPSVYAGLGLLDAVLFCGMTRLMGAARGTMVSHGAGRARLALIGWISTFLFLVFVAFALKVGEQYSRGAALCFFLLGAPLLVTTRVCGPRVLARTLYAHAYRGSEAIIVAPRRSDAHEVLSKELREHGCDGVHIVDFEGDCNPIDWPEERRRLVKRIVDTARVAGPGEIYLLSANNAPERILGIQAGLRLVPRAINLMPTDSVASLLSLPIRRVGSTVAIEMQRVPMSAAARAVKRAIDILVASIALAFVSPAFLFFALAIKLDSRGPVFFRQRRNGFRGQLFRILKFRTMTVLEDDGTVTQAHREDQRVTRVGRWLRATSFDELPQLLNILRGEMALVGPRPHPVALDEFYAKQIEDYELRQHVKPGVTGWAQINGLRGETPTVDVMFRRIEHDLWYASNCSVMLDLQILAKTLFVVLRRDNAY